MHSTFPSLLTSHAPKGHHPSFLLSGYFNNQMQFPFPPFVYIFPRGFSNLRPLLLPFQGFPFLLPNTDPAPPRWGPRGKMLAPHESTSRPQSPGPSTALEHREASAQNRAKGSGRRNTKEASPLLTVGPPLFRSSHICPFLNPQKLATSVTSGENSLR